MTATRREKALEVAQVTVSAAVVVALVWVIVRDRRP